MHRTLIDTVTGMARAVMIGPRMVMIGALVGALVGVPAATAATQDTLLLAEAISIARSNNPALQAARLRADAAGERVAPAGALPDPMLSLGLMNRPFTDPGNTDQPMTMNNVQVTQRFPWPGKLGFGRDQARYLASAEALDAEELAVQLEARVKDVYYQLAFLDGALGIMRETRDLLRNFRDVSSGLFAVGTGLQQDVLQAQVAVASMTEDITVTEQNRVALAARFNALLGQAPTVPVGPAVLGTIDVGLPTVEELMASADEARPALQAAAERVAAASAGVRAAGRAVYPDVTVTFGYAHRPQFVDFSSLMVGISLPLFAGSRYGPLRREMAARHQEAEARAQDLYNETYARLAELRAEAERARNLAGLYAGSILPQARAAVESALSSYRVGQVDYMTLVNNEMTVNRYEIESLRLRAEYLQAVARIEALVGAVTEEGS